MFKKVLKYSGVLLRKTGNYLIRSSQDNHKVEKSIILKKGEGRDLYKTKFNDLFWLNNTGFIDQSIIYNGIYEEASTQILKQIIKKGDCVFDVGANIGYFSVLLSRLVGDQGKVYCFEPTQHFSDVLLRNLNENKIQNAEVMKFGFSDQTQQVEIQIGDSSATLHSPKNELGQKKEIIDLVTLDEYVKKNNIYKIDLIKVDIDGHEKNLLDGGTEFFKTNKPIIQIEFANLNLFIAGTDVIQLKNQLESIGYVLYSEKTKKKFSGDVDFLVECGNFYTSANVWAIPASRAKNLMSIDDL